MNANKELYEFDNLLLFLHLQLTMTLTSIRPVAILLLNAATPTSPHLTFLRHFCVQSVWSRAPQLTVTVEA